MFVGANGWRWNCVTLITFIFYRLPRNILWKFYTSSTSGLGVIALESRQYARFLDLNILLRYHAIAIGHWWRYGRRHGNANTAVGWALHGCMAEQGHGRCTQSVRESLRSIWRIWHAVSTFDTNCWCQQIGLLISIANNYRDHQFELLISHASKFGSTPLRLYLSTSQLLWTPQPCRRHLSGWRTAVITHSLAGSSIREHT